MRDQQAPHLLIVDDEASVRSALQRMLRKENYRLTCVSSAAEALKVAQSDPPDVVISDHLMPEMTGLELLKLLRMRCPHVARIVLTGQAEMETVIAAINEGEVFRFLRKPWDEDEVKLTVHLAVTHARESKAPPREGSRERAHPRGVTAGTRSRIPRHRGAAPRRRRRHRDR